MNWHGPGILRVCKYIIYIVIDLTIIICYISIFKIIRSSEMYSPILFRIVFEHHISSGLKAILEAGTVNVNSLCRTEGLDPLTPLA